ncbi:glycosyltransferase family 2 protein [Nitriliruptoraceae bacterium ZYF776]|nr:glycosyltransferase family 2 protein [Profundirhabdus halotolerans]
MMTPSPARHGPTVHAPSVAVVLVTHQTRDEVLGALATLDGSCERVVVDTGSRDGTADAVRAAHPDVRVLELVNAGFARGANAGIRACDAEVVVLANADVRFAPGAVHRLASALRDEPGVGALGPRVVYPDGRPQASARSLPDLRTAVLHALFGRLRPGNPWTRRYREVDLDPTAPRDVGWVSGCVVALRRDALETVDGFDPGYPLYVEDVDLCLRLRDAGWRIRYEPSAEVVHRVGASTGARRLRALTWHAHGLDRLVGRRYGRRPGGRLLRAALRVGLVGWVGVSWVLERALPGPRSTTGERLSSRPEGTS